MAVLAMDFGGSSVKYARVGRDGTIAHAGKKPAPLDSAEAFLATVSELYKTDGDGTEGIAISIPGYVNADTGELTGSGAYANLYGRNVIALIQEKLPVCVCVENDGRCGALAEAWTGSLAGCEDGIVLILGSGIAGGILKNKKIHAGKSLAAGEFSNFIVNPAQPNFMGEAVMNCAAFGLTYKLCKAKNLDLSVQDLGQVMLGIDRVYGGQFPAFEAAPEKIRADGKQLAQWLAEGDAAAKRVYSDFLDSLAFMIVNIQITYAPERIVIGGGLSRIGNMLSDLQEKLDAYYASTGFGSELQASVSLSRYLDACNILGAAYNFYQRYPEAK